MDIKKMLGEPIELGIVKLSHKDSGTFSGVLAQMLIINAVFLLESDLYLGVFNIIYSFAVLLPISYYNMREHEKEGE